MLSFGENSGHPKVTILDSAPGVITLLSRRLRFRAAGIPQRGPQDALVTYLPATASKACGFVLAIAGNVRAAPLGCLRPCSQPCKVRTDTPVSAAN